MARSAVDDPTVLKLAEITSWGWPLEALCELVHRLQAHIDLNANLEISAKLHGGDPKRLMALFGRARMMIGGKLATCKTTEDAWFLLGRTQLKQKMEFAEEANALMAFSDEILGDVKDVQRRDRIALDRMLLTWAFENFKKWMWENNHIRATYMKITSVNTAMSVPHRIVDNKFPGLLDHSYDEFRRRVCKQLGLSTPTHKPHDGECEWIPEWENGEDKSTQQLEPDEPDDDEDDDDPKRDRYEDWQRKREQQVSNVIRLPSATRPRMPKKD